MSVPVSGTVDTKWIMHGFCPQKASCLQGQSDVQYVVIIVNKVPQEQALQWRWYFGWILKNEKELSNEKSILREGRSWSSGGWSL